MNVFRLKGGACRALLLTIVSVFLASPSFGEGKRNWANLEKVPKPTHNGIHDKIEESYLYLNHNGRSTCVPKASLLNQSSRFDEQVSMKPRYQVVSWFEFMRVNYSWIRAFPVSWKQATGKSPLGENNIGNFKNSNNLLVATYLKNPISINLHKEDEQQLALSF